MEFDYVELSPLTPLHMLLPELTATASKQFLASILGLQVSKRIAAVREESI